MIPKLYIIMGSNPCAKLMLALYYCKVDFELVTKNLDELKSEEFLKINPHGKVPALETEDGNFYESNAILYYIAKKYNTSNLYDNDLKNQMLIDQTFHMLETSYEIKYSNFIYNLFGFKMPHLTYNENVHKNNIKNFSESLKSLNQLLKDKTYLVLNRLTIADILLFNILRYPFSFVYDENRRKAYPNLVKFINNFVSQEFYTKNFGKYRFCQKQFGLPKIDLSKKPEKKVVKKEEKKVEQEEEKKEIVFPKTNFNFFNFKTFFVNEPNRKLAVERLLNEYDEKAFSIYYLQYIKYGDEGRVTYLTSNLMNGFISRAEHMRKHILGVHAILGDEPNLEIEGIWIWNWVDGMFPLMEQHDQYEVYNYRRLDPKKDEDKKLIFDFMTLYNEDEDKFNGQTARVVKFVK